jgi:hypothetical protein
MALTTTLLQNPTTSVTLNSLFASTLINDGPSQPSWATEAAAAAVAATGSGHARHRRCETYTISGLCGGLPHGTRRSNEWHRHSSEPIVANRPVEVCWASRLHIIPHRANYSDQLIEVLSLVAGSPEWRMMNEELCGKPSSMQVIRIDLLDSESKRVCTILGTKILGHACPRLMTDYQHDRPLIIRKSDHFVHSCLRQISRT